MSKKTRTPSPELKFARRRNWLLYRLSGALAHVRAQIAVMEEENPIDILITDREYHRLIRTFDELEKVILDWKASGHEAKTAHIQRLNYAKFSRKAA